MSSDLHQKRQPRIAISGATGLIGRAVAAALTREGWDIVPVTRSATTAGVVWDLQRGIENPSALEGLDAFLHLAGESISGRWTRKKMDLIRRSRVDGTQRMVEALRRLSHPPRAFLCASAIGYYGSRGDARLTEQCPPGTGFLPEVCSAWEAAAARAGESGARCVCLRFGIVLSDQAGALAQMLTPFRLGLGGPLGDGRNYLSWIALPDAVAAVRHCLAQEQLAGPVNIVAPHPVTSTEFARVLGRVLGRPAVLPIPAFALRLAVGRLADEALLASVRVVPERLVDTGFTFRFPTLEGALRHALQHDAAH